MKRNLLTVVLGVLVMLVSLLAGAGAGKIVPMLSRAPSAGLASAAELNIKPLAPLTPTGSGFTYQGSLKSAGNPANGSYDFVFRLYDALAGGALVTTPITLTNQTVTSGLFTVTVDFGASAFDGNGRWLEIAVRPSGGGGYTTLSPRQPITPAPYALFALKSAPYKNVVVVAQSGGQFTSIQAALNSITDASSTNHYLVYVAPGIYTEQVTMKQWVDIEGAGEQATTITFTGSTNGNTGTVLGVNNAELRHLTVANTGANNYAIAIYNSGASPSLLHVTAVASGGGSSNDAIDNYSNSAPNMTYVTASASGGANDIGILNNGSSSNMTNVVASASGGSASNYAFDNYNHSSPNMTNVTATAYGGTGNAGIFNESSSPRIVGNIVTATGATNNYGIYSYNTSSVTIDSSKITVPITGTTVWLNQSTVRIGVSQLAGGPVTINSGTLTCYADYDENYTSPGLNVCP